LNAGNLDISGIFESGEEGREDRGEKVDKEVREDKEVNGEKAAAVGASTAAEGSYGMRRRGSTESVANSNSNSNNNTEHNVTARNRLNTSDARSPSPARLAASASLNAADDAVRPKDAGRRSSTSNSNNRGKSRESEKGTGTRKMRISYLPQNSPLRTLRRSSNAVSPSEGAAGEGSWVTV
jgi:hypothetical protein